MPAIDSATKPVRSTLVLLAAIAALVLSAGCDDGASSATQSNSATSATSSGPTRAAARPGRGRGKGKRPNKGAANEPVVADDGDRTMLTVPMRIFLLESKVTQLNATIDEARVRELVAGANEVWKEAGIRFELQSMTKAKAQNEDAYKAYLDGRKKGERNKDLSGADKQKKRELVASIAPTDVLKPDGVDVFILDRMIGAGGVFKCRNGFVLFPQNGPKGKPNHAKVLAHELGHALGLSHTKCAPDANLMMEPCEKRVPDASSLSSAQIATARALAKSGKKRVCGTGEGDVED